MAEEKKTRKPIDWAAVEKDYRAGVLTDRALGAMHGVSHAAVQKRAKRDGWSKDLTERIRQKAEDKVAKDEVAKEVANSEAVATEKQIIDANAEMMANVIRGHRHDATRLRAVVNTLLEKVELVLSESALFAQIGEICAKPDDNGSADKVNEIYHKVIALPSQTDTTKKLAETLKLLIELERKIFKIEEAPEDPAAAAARGAAEGAAKGMGEFSRSVLADLSLELKNEASA